MGLADLRGAGLGQIAGCLSRSAAPPELIATRVRLGSDMGGGAIHLAELLPEQFPRQVLLLPSDISERPAPEIGLGIPVLLTLSLINGLISLETTGIGRRSALQPEPPAFLPPTVKVRWPCRARIFSASGEDQERSHQKRIFHRNTLPNNACSLIGECLISDILYAIFHPVCMRRSKPPGW